MSQRAATDTSRPTPQIPQSNGESSTLTPSSSASNTPPSRGAPIPGNSLRNIDPHSTMADQAGTKNEHHDANEPEPVASTDSGNPPEDEKPPSTKKKSQCTKPKEHKKVKKSGKLGKKAKHEPEAAKSDSTTDESSSEVTSESSSSEDDTSEHEVKAKKRKAKLRKAVKKAKEKKRRKSKKVESDPSSSASSEDESESEDTDSSSEDEPPKRKKKSAKKSKKTALPDPEEEDEISSDAMTMATIKAQVEALIAQVTGTKAGRKTRAKKHASVPKSSKSKRKPAKRDKESSIGFKRVDQLWDSAIHNYKLKESADDDDGEFSEYAFLVRRTFNWENRYELTLVDIKSKPLRAALQEVLKGCKSTTLEAEEPSLDPNTLFLYLDELRTHYKKTLKSRIKAEKKRKAIKLLKTQRSACKALVAYLDEDYAETNKTLKPLLEAGNITFDLLWALHKPNEVAITSTYGSWDEARCFKVDYVNKHSNLSRGEWYAIEGNYLDYDGKKFGLGEFEADVDSFKGPRKITSLACYPLKYHSDIEGVKQQIVDRGRKFLELGGMHYRFHKGLAFMKRKKVVARVNVNSRIMVDPGIFRRINPNYPISIIKPYEADGLVSDSEFEQDDCSCCEDDSDEAAMAGTSKDLHGKDPNAEAQKQKWKFVKTPDGCYERVYVDVDEDGNPVRRNTVEDLDKGSDDAHTYTDDELLLTSPVVLGFAFNEKMWLEFSISGVKDIDYNEKAFDSLVLPDNQKKIVKALVESHKFNGANTIDDVIQGKGRGLVAVLHGPPGTGKTLTAEGISELLRCPLYMISCGELGTDAMKLEIELQRILDIAHSWGAVLLLDEADVFLEKRQVTDLHRNSLVSVFLRLLEYFQGILFLTTNRVETFDDAFASRIHVALRYGDLTGKAKKTVWKTFIDLCRAQPGRDGVIGSGVGEFTDRDFEMLSRAALNGRQIKNIVRTAQALALNEGVLLDLAQIKSVLEVSETFDRDLKGGPGYLEAMRSYT